MEIEKKIRHSRAGRLLPLVLAGGFSLLACSAGAQDRKAELSFSLWIPPVHATFAPTKEWADSIRTASNGTIDITIFPSEQLGKAFDHYDMARDGIADIALVNPGYQQGRFPVSAAIELPFMFKSARGGASAMVEWYRKYAAREMGDVKVCLIFPTEPAAFHARREVREPSQLKGMRIRPANATVSTYLRELGATTVPASIAEAREVLDRGLADGITVIWSALPVFKLQDSVSHHTDIKLSASVNLYVINNKKYASLSNAQKKVIDDHCTGEWAEKMVAPWVAQEESARKQVSAMKGHTLIVPTDKELAAWIDSGKFLADAWAQSVKPKGVDGTAALEELRALLRKHNAGFSD